MRDILNMDSVANKIVSDKCEDSEHTSEEEIPEAEGDEKRDNINEKFQNNSTTNVLESLEKESNVRFLINFKCRIKK